MRRKGGYTMLKRAYLCLSALAIGLAYASPLPASGGGEGDMNPLSPSAIKGDLALWTAVVFLCVLAVLWKFAWRPIADGLDKREHHVADQIAQAEAANQKAKDILGDYERKLAGAQEQVRSILEQGRRHAEQLGQEMLDKAKEEAQLEYQKAVKQIDAATGAAIKELATQSANLAVDLAGKIVRAKLKPGDHARLIDQAVAGFVQNKIDPSKVSQN
jgi:F-type H+-transporting ATPase subunit b